MTDENASSETGTTTTKGYVPSRQHQVSGTSLRHDPNIQSSTIENLDDDDDDDEDVYDPNKPTLFQKIQNQTNNQSKDKTSHIPANPTQPRTNQRDETVAPTDASEDDLNQAAIFRGVFHQENEMDTIPALNDKN